MSTHRSEDKACTKLSIYKGLLVWLVTCNCCMRRMDKCFTTLGCF